VHDRDPHSALKSDIIHRISKDGAEFVLARLQYGKTDIRSSLHVSPNTYSSSGLQTTDFLATLGFQRSDQCPFANLHRCYVKWVDEDFQIGDFANAFSSAYTQLVQAEQGLNACGFALPRNESYAHFGYGSGAGANRGPRLLSGDGHTARKVERMKRTEDERFRFQFNFVETEHEAGFVTHYRPQHPPLSAEMVGVFRYLGLKQFDECPEFDFEQCYYRTLLFQQYGDGPWESNTDNAHRIFDAHASRFSTAIQCLLMANAEVEKVGMPFLPLPTQQQRLDADIRPNIQTRTRREPAANAPPPKVSGLPANFDVAISFAGPERDEAHRLAEILREAGYVVFYDDFYPEQLWGKDLVAFFDEIFRKRSRYCVVFVSQEYRDRKWTSHELRSAQARALEEKGQEYILPIKVDDIELDGLQPTIGYVPIAQGIEKIAELLIKKLS
jgi:TIR domain